MSWAPFSRRALATAIWIAVACAWGIWAIFILPSGRVSARGPHALALPEFGAGQPITQVFTMTSDTLRGIRVRLAASRAADVRLDYRISTAKDGVFTERCRAQRAVARLNGSQWVALDCGSIQATRGVPMALEIRAVQITPGEDGAPPGVELKAVRDRLLPRSYLLVNGRERWGALEFDALGDDDTAWGRFRSSAWHQLPGWMQAPGLLVFALAGYSVLVVLAVVILSGAWRGGEAVPPAKPRAPAAVVVCVCLTVALAAVLWIARQEHGAINFIDELYAAELESTWPMHEGFERLDVEIGSETLPAIVALPVSRMAWRVTVPAAARLRTAVSVLPIAWTQPIGDGVYFRVVAVDGGESVELFARLVDPAHVDADRRWLSVDIDLSRFAGRAIDLVLVTEPSAPGLPIEPSYDFGAWGAPRIAGR